MDEVNSTWMVNSETTYNQTMQPSIHCMQPLIFKELTSSAVFWAVSQSHMGWFSQVQICIPTVTGFARTANVTPMLALATVALHLLMLSRETLERILQDICFNMIQFLILVQIGSGWRGWTAIMILSVLSVWTENGIQIFRKVCISSVCFHKLISCFCWNKFNLHTLFVCDANKSTLLESSLSRNNLIYKESAQKWPALDPSPSYQHLSAFGIILPPLYGCLQSNKALWPRLGVTGEQWILLPPTWES